MKYCLPYNKNTYQSNLINDADEWSIDYNPEDKTLFKFLDTYKDRRINFRIWDKIDIKDTLGVNFIKDLQKEYPNVYIQFPQYTKEIANIIKENEIKNFFFSTYVNNIDLFYSIINTGVSDIYIAEALGFELNKISKVAKEKNVRIRVFPNIAQSLTEDIPDLKKFFIRPEDIQDYENFVDVCEFFYEDKKCINYFNIYKNKQEWFGDLSEIINGLNIKLDSRFMLPRFGELRSRCGKKCFYGEPCHICDLIEESAKSMEEAGIIVEKEKKNNG